MLNNPPNSWFGPLFSIAIVQDRPRERLNLKKSKEEVQVRELMQKFLVLQSDDDNRMEEIFEHGGVSFELKVCWSNTLPVMNVWLSALTFNRLVCVYA